MGRGGSRSLMIFCLYLSSLTSVYGLTRTLTSTTPFSVRPRMLFMKRAFPMLLSYWTSRSWAMSMLAEPADGVASEKP